MFGTSQIVFAVVPFGRVFFGADGEAGSEGLHFLYPRPRDPNTIKYLLRRCVCEPPNIS